MVLASEQWNKSEHFWMKTVAMEISLSTWRALVFNKSEDFRDVFQFAVEEKYQPVVDLACGRGRLFLPQKIKPSF